MAKRVDPAKAKAAKQKKMAIVLGVLLVAVMAIQGPKMLKLLGGRPGLDASAMPAGTAVPAGVDLPAGVAAGAPAATPTPTPTPGGAAPATAAGGITGTTTTPQAAVLVNSDTGVVPEEGQLLSFEQFAAKDPFAQQAEDVAPPPGAATGSTTTPAATGTTTTIGDPAPPTGSVSPSTTPATPTTPTTPTTKGSGAGAIAGGTPGPTPAAPAEPAVPATPAAATTISVNGEVSTVVADTPFPVAEPTFELVSVATDGTSVQIGIAGGQLSGSSPTVKLVLGKKLTLQNTADGSRYELQLLTVAGFVTPAPAKK